MDTLNGIPRLECPNSSLVNSLTKTTSILVLIAKAFLHSHSLSFFQKEPACASSSSCRAVSLVCSKGLVQGYNVFVQELATQCGHWTNSVQTKKASTLIS
jgi:hypothetical protein